MSKWFQNHRVEWIIEIAQVYGFINRRHIQAKFGISNPQAANDMKAALSAKPGFVFYNTSSKRYEVRK